MSYPMRLAWAFVLALAALGCGRGVTLGVDPANADAASAADAGTSDG